MSDSFSISSSDLPSNAFPAKCWQGRARRFAGDVAMAKRITRSLYAAPPNAFFRRAEDCPPCLLPFLIAVVLSAVAPAAARAEDTVEQWGIFELTLKGPTNGNPFVDTHCSARFAWDLGDSAAT